MMSSTGKINTERKCLQKWESLSAEVLSDSLAHVDNKMIWERVHRDFKDAPGTIQKGIEALKLNATGFKRWEIAEMKQVTVGQITVWISRARKYLIAQSDFSELMDKSA